MLKKLTILFLVLGVALVAVACGGTQPAPAATPTTEKIPTPSFGSSGTPTSAATAAAPATAAASPTVKPKVGGTLKWAASSETYGIDPSGAAGRVSYGGAGRVARLIYNGLLQYEPETQKLLPELATEWSVSTDGREITFKLRPNVKFTDGTVLNAEAVKFHYDRMLGFLDPKQVGRFKANYAFVTRLDVVDDLTVKFVLSKPQASLINFLGDPSSYIPSPTAYKKDPDAFLRNPVGTGPMKVQEWTKDVRWVLVKNPDYWEKDAQGTAYPYLDSIVVSPIPDSAVQIANVRTGAMDYADEVPAEEQAKLKSDTNVVLYQKVSNGVEALYPYYAKPPFDKQACVEAFFGAIDKQAISQGVFLGMHPAAETIISPASAYYDPNTKGIPFDLNRAKQKLVECGQPNGFDVDMPTLNVPRIVKWMEAIQQQTAKIGIKVNVRVGDTTSTIADRTKYNGMALYEGSYSDPIHYMGDFFCTSPGNWNKGCNPQLEKLFDDAESTFDFAKRKAILQEIAKQVSYTPTRLWPIVNNPEVALTTKKVKGVRMGPQLLQQFKWLWLDQ